ncbi:MAG TPA: tyrosine-type recombinase/integrase [Candidatus Acidoferrales bacterium]|nr:tyrosine-type recombinase/integrase [Candidatus Acidoferrales bacterium]
MGRTQEGQLRKRFGAWHLVYYITAPDGSRKQKSHRLCDDSLIKSQAKQLRNEFLRTQVNIGIENAGPMGVVVFWDSVYLPFIESTNNLKPSTVHGYKQVWNQHLKLHFGTMHLSEYRTHMMSVFLTGLAKTLRPRTLNAIKWLASAIFAHAVATGKCEANPIRDAKVLGKTLGHGDTKSYTLEQMENVITALVDHVDAQLVMALSFFAGMRKGEIQGLQWGDIDGEFIHVRRAFSRGVAGTPKSKKSLRAIPLIQPVRGLLMLWRSKAGDGVAWVFPNSEGKAWDMADFATKVIKPALKKAGIEWKGFHAGRRGVGTALKALTGNSNAGRDLLGHTTTRVTEEHYEDRMPLEMLKGMKLLEEKVK